MTSSKFFQQPVAKKVKKKRERVPGTHITRCLELENDIRKKWAMSSLYIGGIGELDIPEKMANNVADFWAPITEEVTYNSDIYMGGGSYAGNNVATRLNKAGLTYYSYKMKEAGLDYSKRIPHQEYKIFNPEYGWAGKVDLILDTNMVNHYGKKTIPDKPPVDRLWEPYEVKCTGANNFAKWTEGLFYPKKYRMQLGLYIDDLHNHGIIKNRVGHFLLLHRDNPNAKRVSEYVLEEDLIAEAKNSATTFWKHIREKSFPENFENHRGLTPEVIRDIATYQTIYEARKWPEIVKESILSEIGGA